METGVPNAIRFQTKPQIALAQFSEQSKGRCLYVLLADEIYASNRESGTARRN